MKSFGLRKNLVLLIVFLVFTVMMPITLAAQASYVDVGINVPFYWGLGTTEINNDDISGAIDYIFPVPDLTWGMMFGKGPVKIGGGLRFFTIILESLAYPEFLVRAEFDPLVLRAGIGGGAFLLFGLWNDVAIENIWLLEATAAYKVNDWFQLGLGTTVLYLASDNDALSGGYAYVPYVFGRFALGGE
jgi:hypothetical protein